MIEDAKKETELNENSVSVSELCEALGWKRFKTLSYATRKIKEGLWEETAKLGPNNVPIRSFKIKEPPAA